MNTEELKNEIKKSYGDIAKGNIQIACCSSDNTCCSSDVFSKAMTEDYSNIVGYNKGADFSLGCGLPTEIANIHEGDTVLDLGSGAGNDAFIARRIVGDSGKVIGIDMTPEMVIRALQNAQKLGYNNVEFVLGDIENMKEVSSDVADVVISNCVMNLVPDKVKAFNEINRVLKVGGHFSISDIVFQGTIPQAVLKASEMYVGCVAGASEKGQYLAIIKNAKFKNIQIKKERLIVLPDEILLKYLNQNELTVYKESGSGIYSVTVYADKLEEGSCCNTTENACCGSELKTDDITHEKTSCCGSTENKNNTSCC
jgi:ubiquinone/menaquinone biosynthesis C-methylase UbiE